MNPIARMMKRYVKTPLKYALPLLFIGSLALVSISGCTSPTSSNQAASTAPTASTSVSASASVTPSNTPSVTPSADVYQVVVSGPTNGQYGAVWTATIYKNGVVVPCDQLTGQVSWYINGQPSNGGTFGGSQCTMTHDANGLAGSPFERTNTITAAYQGVTSAPAYYTDPEIGSTPVPTATPTSTPTPTATIELVSMPASVSSGSTMTITFRVVNSITGAGMSNVPVYIKTAMGPDGTVTTGASGEGTYSWTTTPGGVGTTTQYVFLYCDSTASIFGPNAYVGSSLNEQYQLISPVQTTVGNATA